MIFNSTTSGRRSGLARSQTLFAVFALVVSCTAQQRVLSPSGMQPASDGGAPVAPTLPAGALIRLLLVDPLYSRTATPGQWVLFQTQGGDGLPPGLQVSADVVAAQSVSRFHTPAFIQLQFLSLRLSGGRLVQLRATLISGALPDARVQAGNRIVAALDDHSIARGTLKKGAATFALVTAVGILSHHPWKGLGYAALLGAAPAAAGAAAQQLRDWQLPEGSVWTIRTLQPLRLAPEVGQ